MKFTHKLITIAPNFISSQTSAKLSKFFLALQGIGWGGDIESSGELKLIKRTLKDLSNPIVFDVGAHVGEYALVCAQANRAATIHCFEPSYEHFVQLNGSIRKSKQNFVLNNFGLSGSSGTQILYKDRSISGLASTKKRNLEHLGLNLSKEELCQFLDPIEYCEKNRIENIDLLKIDTEGAEFEILKAFKSFFQEKKISLVQFEFGHAMLESKLYFRDFFNFFSLFDYRVSILLPNGEVDPIETYDERYENFYMANFIATKNE
jgi:FkbM family methyltransferase